MFHHWKDNNRTVRRGEQTIFTTNKLTKVVADILRQGIDKRNHYSFFSVRQAFFGMLSSPL